MFVDNKQIHLLLQTIDLHILIKNDVEKWINVGSYSIAFLVELQIHTCHILFHNYVHILRMLYLYRSHLDQVSFRIFFCKQLLIFYFYFLVQDIIIVGYYSTVHVLERLVLVIFLDMLNSYITVHPFLVNKGWTSLFLRIWTALDI